MGTKAAENTRRSRVSQTGRRADVVVGSVRPIAERVCADHGLYLWDLRFAREAGRDTLSVLVDRVGGVVSQELSDTAEDLGRELDHSDAVPGNASYVLDVSSPGAERKLAGAEQFTICTGRKAHVVTSDGRTLDGPITEATDTTVQIGDERVNYTDIARAQLVVSI